MGSVVLPDAIRDSLRNAFITSGFTRQWTYRQMTGGVNSLSFRFDGVLTQSSTTEEFDGNNRRVAKLIKITLRPCNDIPVPWRMGDQLVDTAGIVYTITSHTNNDVVRLEAVNKTTIAQQRDDMFRSEGG